MTNEKEKTDMNKIKFMLRELDSNNKYKNVKEVILSSIPRINEKIFVNNDKGVAYVYQVQDIHHGEEGVDVLSICLGSGNEYNSKIYP